MAGERKHALVVRGGWSGHEPVAASDRYAAELARRGWSVEVSETLDSYLDAEALARTDLVVQCWTMGGISAAQAAGLSGAVRAGTGLAGWHGGIVDSFREETGYQLLIGGQFVHHPREFTRYQVRPTAAGREHPALAGEEPFTVTTEQYYLHVDPAVLVLADTVFTDDPDVPELAGTVVPVVWARTWGAGRVFVSTLGHRPADLELPEVDRLTRRGLLWAAR
ncbi:ThuA domain-containing protein [Streptacidiphilus sp. EB129]|uniref:ThuA domain-containing protein n=1 Tax=Streptacidiphilus sp. EB129 TaxID=3156262 RepID=UPI00351143AF